MTGPSSVRLPQKLGKLYGQSWSPYLPAPREKIHSYILGRVPGWDVLGDVRAADFHDGTVSKHVSLTVGESVFGDSSAFALVEHRISSGPDDIGLVFPNDFEKIAADLGLLLDEWGKNPPSRSTFIR